MSINLNEFICIIKYQNRQGPIFRQSCYRIYDLQTRLINKKFLYQFAILRKTGL